MGTISLKKSLRSMQFEQYTILRWPHNRTSKSMNGEVCVVKRISLTDFCLERMYEVGTGDSFERNGNQTDPENTGNERW